jgi:hypothetical protein
LPRQESNLRRPPSEGGISPSTESSAELSSRFHVPSSKLKTEPAAFQPGTWNVEPGTPAAVVGIEPTVSALTERRLTIRLHTAVCGLVIASNAPGPGALIVTPGPGSDPVWSCASPGEGVAIERPEPEPPAEAWPRALGVRGLFGKPGHETLQFGARTIKTPPTPDGSHGSRKSFRFPAEPEA